MAIRTNFCPKKCTCRILSGQIFENFAEGQMGCPSKNCQLQRRQMDLESEALSQTLSSRRCV